MGLFDGLVIPQPTKRFFTIRMGEERTFTVKEIRMNEQAPKEYCFKNGGEIMNFGVELVTADDKIINVRDRKMKESLEKVAVEVKDKETTFVEVEAGMQITLSHPGKGEWYARKTG